ncbi:glycohydrolase toxin TNT-related protein [Arcanobacterium wilhelmae]|uniref:glycohydrolase toxin TNT-related protein n=1 Tax=Arcanobacterium wilhelmae TaxID=1803177 RepID=UPI0024157A9B|nr:glycohydrolase toxin TNT-related protein [Arcanobacterium wilhelmae]WFN90289.1 glycohydrolase toxin TNT-related protein [Arcanobacterium wilhelmae]
MSSTDPLGHTTSFRETDGAVVTSVDSEPAYTTRVTSDGRHRTVIDHVRGITQSMLYDRRGRLIEHSVDGRTTTWEYTPSGRRARQISPNGDVTRYVYDAVGHLIAIDHSALGHVDFTYDAANQLTAMTTPSGRHEWSYERGLVTRHTRINGQAGAVTSILRDPSRRISTIATPTGTVSYGYDVAGQLTSITSRQGATHFTYDDSGRLKAETGPTGHREYSYNTFGQLASITDGDTVVSFTYDAAGHRVSEHGPAGREVTYEWDGRGYLHAVTSTDGVTHRVLTDAVGNPVRIDETNIVWDPTSPIAQPIQEGTASVLPLPGGALFHDGDTISWRTARTRSFLSMDTLARVCDQVAGANTYAYANNNPLAYVDPWGMRPATDADLDAYKAELPGSKWEYVLGTAAIVGGIAATVLMGPVGGAIVGGFLISAGMSTITQKYSTGTVDPTQVLFDGAIGAVSGLAGSAAGRAVTAMATNRLGATFASRALGYVADAFTGSVIDTTATALTTPGYGASDFGHDFLINAETGLAFSTIGGEISHRMDIAHTQPDTSPDVQAAHSMSATDDAPLAATKDIPQSTSTELVPYYPPNDGASGDWERVFLYAGEKFDRYGKPTGKYLADVGTPDWQRALPHGVNTSDYHVYEVVKPFEVEMSTIAPCFDQPGGGVQYRTPVKLETLIERGIIKEVTP